MSNIFIYFCPHGKSFLGGAREGKADYLQSPNVSKKCVALLLFDSLKIFRLDPEATTEDEPLPAIYYAWLVAQENIFLISDDVFFR